MSPENYRIKLKKSLLQEANVENSTNLSRSDIIKMS